MTVTSHEVPLEGKEARQALLKAARRFLPYLRPHWFWLSVATLMAILNSIATIAVMYTVMAGIGQIVIGDMSAVRSTAINLVVLTVAENIIRIIYNSAMIRINESLSVTIRNDLVVRLHNVQLSRHVSQASGEWVTRVLFEANRFRGFLTKSLMEVANSVIWFLAFAVFLLALSPLVALPTLVTIPLMVWIAVVWTKRLRPDTRKQRESWDQMVGYLDQRIEGLADIRSFGQEEAVLADLRARSEEYSTVHNRLSRKRLWLTSHLGFSVFLALGLLIFFGGLQIINGHQLGSGFFFDMAAGMMPMTWMLMGTDTMMASMGMASGTALAAARSPPSPSSSSACSTPYVTSPTSSDSRPTSPPRHAASWTSSTWRRSGAAQVPCRPSKARSPSRTSPSPTATAPTSSTGSRCARSPDSTSASSARAAPARAR